jgi:hypothetical protein
VTEETAAEPAQRPQVVGTVNPAAVVSPASAALMNCPTCGQANPPVGTQASTTGWGHPVHAVGKLRVDTATIGADKQLAQLTGGAHQGGQVEVGLLKQVLSRRENAWIGWQLAWVFSSGGMDAFAVVPRDRDEVRDLAEALSPPEDREVVHVIKGCTVPAPINSPSAAAGLPAVQACELMAFTLQEFAAGMPDDEASSGEKSPAPERKTNRAEFEALVPAVFLRLTNGAAIPGFTAEQQARAFVGSTYLQFYSAILSEQRKGMVLAGVYARHIHSADRQVVAVGFTVRDPRTDMTDGWECLADVTECCLPFLITGLRHVYA